jgi:signal transduction histidine kinase
MGDARVSTELRIVHDLAKVVAGGPYDFDEILERVSAAMRDAFGFERVLFVRYRPGDRTIFAPVQLGIDWPGDEWLRIDKFPFLVEALDSGRTTFVEDARAAGAIPERIIERFGVRSIVAIPLSAESQCLGFIVGDRSGGAFKLGESDLAFLNTLGTVAAVFVAKAEQYTDLQRLEQAKSDFISIASHELRTPISVVAGIASTLEHHWDELDPGRLGELRTALYDSTRRLGRLAEQLLDLSQLDAGMVVLRPETFIARERLESLLASTVPEHADLVQLDVPPALKLTCDLHAFERIVSNLLVNALKYGRPPVVVRVAAGGAVTISIEDRGLGVDPAFAPQLFDRFARSDGSRSSQATGAGLGLSIARSYARALGGELTYERADPTGARFTIALPV